MDSDHLLKERLWINNESMLVTVQGGGSDYEINAVANVSSEKLC